VLGVIYERVSWTRTSVRSPLNVERFRGWADLVADAMTGVVVTKMSVPRPR